MENKLISKTFGWLFIGLLATFISGYITASTPSILYFFFSGKMYWLIFIAEIAIALILGVKIYKMKASTAKILYITYALLTGLTFGCLFIMFQVASIIYIFLATALIFGIFAIIGETTKIDLSKLGIYLLMALIAVIILEIINMFVMSNTLNMTTCIIGIIIFMGYIAYDMQNITKLAEHTADDNSAIYGAFQLYLDFINLFIRLLELFGNRKD